MNILLLVDCYFPSTKSSAKQMHDLAVQFHRCGHHVIVCTPEPAITAPTQVAVEDGVTVLRVRTGRIKGAGKFIRALNEIRLSSVLWGAGQKFFCQNRCDLVIFYSPSIFFGALVGKLKSLFKCPAYLILRDIFPQWAVDAGVLKKGLIWRYFRRKEFAQYREADVIGVQSPANLDYFHENPIGSERKFEVLYNWGSPPDSSIKNLGFREKWGLQRKVVFFYGGNIGVAQDIDNIVRLAEKLRDDERIFFLLVGEGSEVHRLRELITRKSLSNIAIKDSVSQEEYLSMVGEFNVGLISLDRNLKTHNFPGKLFSYLFHGIPVLASINAGNDLRDILEKSCAGLVSLNGDDVSLEVNALKLTNDAALRQQLGSNGKHLLASKFSVQGAVSQILANFSEASRPIKLAVAGAIPVVATRAEKP
jgi:glycosyltransferase involved in cell wall biosynthesis